MDEASAGPSLNRISTLWTLVRTAHGPGADDEARVDAQAKLLERYQRAIYRYLLHVLRRDADAADELFQEFALRFLRGDFKGADQRRGRFRDFLKGVLIHLVADHHRRLQRQPGPLPAGV